MPKILKWELHAQKWSNCDRCSLSTRRSRVVLAKGKLPCKILFIGEAPGASENLIGIPFIGPAGHLLDDMIDQARTLSKRSPSLAFTNIIGCIPFGENRRKITEPPSFAIEACEERLVELIKIANPERIVPVGTFSEKRTRFLSPEIPKIPILHPAYLLRLGIERRGLEIQRTTIILADLFEEV